MGNKFEPIFPGFQVFVYLKNEIQLYPVGGCLKRNSRVAHFLRVSMFFYKHLFQNIEQSRARSGGSNETG